MNKFFLISAFLSWASMAQAEVVTLTPSGGGAGGGTLTSGTTPVSGCSPGQFLYNNSGLLGCQSGSGGISSPGTTVVGDLVTWNSPTGAAIADSGFSISGGTLTGPATLSLTLLGSSGHGLLFGSNGGATWTIPYNSSNLYPSADNVSQLGLATNRVSSGFFVNLGSTSAGINNIYLQGSSTGTDLLQSGNSSVTNRTITIPAGTVADTLALLSASQTFSGAVTYSGTTQFSGAGPASGPAANTTWVQGGSTAPTLGTNAGVLAVGGIYSAGTLSTAGQGAISLSTSFGLQLQGKSNSSSDITLLSGAGTYIADFSPGYGAQFAKISNFINNHVIQSSTAPSISSGATIGTTNGTSAFTFTATAASATTVVTMNTTAATGWICPAAVDFTTPATSPLQTATTTTTVTFTPYARNSTTPMGTWTNADLVGVTCWAY